MGIKNLRSSLSLASVGADVLRTTENLERGVSLDTIFLAEVRLLSAVNLGKLDVLLLEGGSSFLVLGGEGLAVATPGSEDYRSMGSAFQGSLPSFPVSSQPDTAGYGEMVGGVQGYSHSARTRSLDLTKSPKVSLVSWVTSDSAEATAARAAMRPQAMRL